MEEKIARICWNSKNWEKPSGRSGKSTSKDSYEYKNGFGHEEWLFDFEKIINGYHYAYLEAIGNFQKHIGKIYNILLYTRNSDTKEWHWVGQIDKVEVISENEAKNIFEEYKKRMWLDEMKNDIDLKGGNINEMNKLGYFNIRYKKENVVYRKLKLFDENEKVSSARIEFMNISEIIHKEDCDIKITGENGVDRDSKDRCKRRTSEGEKEIELRHDKIKDSFFKYLKNMFPNDTLSKEEEIKGLGCMIDIYHKRINGLKILYEIKACDNIRYSIRLAIGQLLEYGFYPKRNDADKLIIVSDKEITSNIKYYLDNINNKFNLGVGIINYNYKKNIVVEKYNCEFAQ
jgi:hypothetical protein